MMRKETADTNSIEYIERLTELIKIGDDINIVARLIHLKRRIEEEKEQHTKDLHEFAEWCSKEGWHFYEEKWYYTAGYGASKTKTTSQLREIWEVETGKRSSSAGGQFASD